MSCSKEFIDVVCSALAELGNVRARRMMGDYIIYVNDKMVITACDEICYVKKLPANAILIVDADCGCPYEGHQGTLHFGYGPQRTLIKCGTGDSWGVGVF